MPPAAAAQNGRVKGEAKKALRAVIQRYDLPLTITPNQNLILRDIQPAWRKKITAILQARAVALIMVSAGCH